MAQRLDPWLLLAACGSLSVAPAAGPSMEPEAPPLATLSLDGSSSHFVRVGIPQGAAYLRIIAEAVRPLAILIASGYYPSEAHYDASNFHDWALASMRTELILPVADISADACEDAGPQLRTCLERAVKEGGLSCGAATSASLGSPGGAADVGGIDGLTGLYSLDGVAAGAGAPSPCQAAVGTPCASGGCGPELGPAVCNLSSFVSGVGACVCQPGYCAVAGRCVGAEATLSSCAQVTGRLCPSSHCGTAAGPTRCEDGLCVCQAGFCAVDGSCASAGAGASANTADTAGAVVLRSRPILPPAAAGSRRLAVAGVPTTDTECCQVLEDARDQHPEHFARCAARLLGRGVEAFAVKDAHVPKFRPLWEPRLASPANATADVHEVVMSLRLSSQTVQGTQSVLPDEEVAVRLWMFVEPNETALSGPGNTVVAATPLFKWDPFYTMAQLLDSAWTKRYLSLPAWRQMELPHQPLPTGDADSPVVATPEAALHFQLPANEPVLLRIDDRVLQEGGPGTMPHMHVHGLPREAQVLYGRHWPEPRSPMDFGHALLVGREGLGSTWQAAQLDTRHFAVVSPTNASVSTFFAFGPQSHPLVSVPTWTVDDSPAAAIQNAVDEMSSKLPGWAWASASLAATLMCGLLLLIWRRRSALRWRSGGAGSAQPYLAVSGADQDPSFLDGMLSASMAAAGTAGHVAKKAFADPGLELGEAGGSWSSSEGREVMSVSGSARPLLSGLRAVGDSLLEKMTSSTRTGGSSRAGALLHSGFGDDGHGYSAASSSPHTDEEARGLLHDAHDDDDEEEDAACRSLGFGRTSLGSRSSLSARRRLSGGSKSSGGSPTRGSPTRGGESSPSRSLVDYGTAQDQEAVEALMKLRPAARDSIGTGDDLDETPLIGSERSRALMR